MIYTDLFNSESSADAEIPQDHSILTEVEREQHRKRSKKLSRAGEEIHALDDGYAIRFAGTMDVAELVLDYVRYERKRCPFLSFEIAFEPDKQGVWLYVGGRRIGALREAAGKGACVIPGVSS